MELFLHIKVKIRSMTMSYSVLSPPEEKVRFLYLCAGYHTRTCSTIVSISYRGKTKKTGTVCIDYVTTLEPEIRGPNKGKPHPVWLNHLGKGSPFTPSIVLHPHPAITQVKWSHLRIMKIMVNLICNNLQDH